MNTKIVSRFSGWRTASAVLVAGGLAAGGLVVGLSAAIAAIPGLAHHWTFDESSGSTAFDTVGSDDATIGADVTRIAGYAGSGALHFPATSSLDSAVDFGVAAGQFGTADFTISFAFRTTETKNQELVGNRTSPSHGNFAVIRTAGGSVFFEVDEDDWGTHYVAVGSPGGLYADNQWHRVFAIRDDSEVTLWVDGVKYGPNAAGDGGIANISNGNALLAGFSPGVEPCCDTDLLGDLDDVQIYDRALTDAEVIGDADGDGIPDASDECPSDPGNDLDDDGVCAADDNCPGVANSDQADLDGDGDGDGCDADDDGDGAPDATDNCPGVANSDQADQDGDGTGNACDTDDDGDGVLDGDDACLGTSAGDIVDATGCAIAQYCPCATQANGSRWKNHGAYVSCTSRSATRFEDAGFITEPEKDAIVSAAAQSSCGK